MTCEKSKKHVCSTIGKIPEIDQKNGGPGLWDSGNGCRFRDSYDREWNDFDMCLGSVIWGHNRTEILERVCLDLKTGHAATIPTKIEAKAAETILTRLIQYDAVRFFKSGTDATTAAVRIARELSSRDFVCYDGYHGWMDWSISGSYSSKADKLGVPKKIRSLSMPIPPNKNPAESLKHHRVEKKEVAAVVLRPEGWDIEVFQEATEEIRSWGALLIADEVTSHYKYGFQGSSYYKGVKPDLLCIGKGLANGFPLSALLGSEKIHSSALRSEISSTNWSETASLSAMIICENLLNKKTIWPVWENNMREVTNAVQDFFDANRLEDYSLIVHPGSFNIERSAIPFTDDPFRLFLIDQLGKDGIYTRGWFHGSDTHTESVWNILQNSLIRALTQWLENSAH